MTPASTPLIAGKRIEVFGSGKGTPSQLRDHLRRFATYSTLRRLGEIAGPGWMNGRIDKLDGVPMVPFAIPYLALVAIEASNDHRGSRLTV